MPKFIFLDTLVLSDLTESSYSRRLSRFIVENGFTIVTNSTSMVELFNPQAPGHPGRDRSNLTASFLSSHPSVILYPERVIEAEIAAYPEPLRELPVSLDLASIAPHLRERTLLSFLRGEPIFQAQAKDIRRWATGMADMKSRWLSDVEAIVLDACKNRTLQRDDRGGFVHLDVHKEDFLKALDLRHITPELARTLGERLVPLFLYDTAKLPALRASSLSFWYMYVEVDKAYTMKKSGSDIADIYQMALIPYCAAFTLDQTMRRVAERVLADTGRPCQLLNRAELLERLPGVESGQ